MCTTGLNLHRGEQHLLKLKCSVTNEIICHYNRWITTVWLENNLVTFRYIICKNKSHLGSRCLHQRQRAICSNDAAGCDHAGVYQGLWTQLFLITRPVETYPNQTGSDFA